ncbi:MAG: BACON domain-containing protein [Alistipes sp.]|nr:BACON domain-containing protein [Alistipes sp.]
MTNKIFKSLFAVVTMLGVALGFVACETEGDGVVGDPMVDVSASTLNFAMGEGEQIVTVTSNSEWKVEVSSADWVTVTPMVGKGKKSITVSVAENTTGNLREATIKVIALHATYGPWDTESIKVSQSATDAPTVTEELLYGDNFDGQEATKTFGSGSSWPYIDQFPEFANAEGPASENVTYTGSGVSVRANSTSNSSYSDYAGSGSNNIFFGANAYFQINNIALNAAQNNLKLTFGTEKYLNNGDSTFQTSEFHVYVSKNGNGWSELEYTFAGTEPGRWNVATAEFTLTEVPEYLFIKFTADVASAYRIDDVKLFVGNGGQSITLPETGGGNGGNDEPVVAEGPYASDAAFVCSTDDSTNATYSLGATKIGTYAVTGFKLSKSKQSGVFTSAAVGVEGDKYLNFYAAGWKGTEVTIYYRVDGGEVMSQKLAGNDGATGNAPYTALRFAVADHYSVLLSGLKATSTIEFAMESDFSLKTYSGTAPEIAPRAIVCGVKLSDTPIEGEDVEITDPDPSEIKKVTVAEFLAAPEDATIYELTGTIKNVVAGKEYYGNFDLEDSTGSVYIYGLVDDNNQLGYFETLGLKEGDTITLRTIRTSYNGSPQGKNATYVSHTSAGGETPTPDPEQPAPGDVVKATVAEFLVAAESETVIYELTGTIKNVVAGKEYYGNFDLEDSTGSVYIYGLVDDNNQFGYFETLGLKEGDTITLRTIRTSYNGSPQGKNATYVSHTSAGGETPTPDPEQPAPGDVVKATVAEFLAAAESETVIYELTGKIDNVANTDYGNFDLVDATGRVYVYGIYDENGEKVFTSLGLKAGDTLTIRGVRASYNDEPQMGSGVYVSHVAGAEVEQPANEATLSFADVTNRTVFTTEQQVWEQNGITLTNDKGSSTSNVADYSAPARFYKSSNLKVETEKTMTKIVFACNNATYATALKESITTGTATTDGSIVTVVLPSSAKSYSINTLSAQVRMNSLTVTFAE